MCILGLQQMLYLVSGYWYVLTIGVRKLAARIQLLYILILTWSLRICKIIL